MHIGRVSAARRALHLAALLVSLCVPLRAASAQTSPVFFWSVCKHDEVFNPSDIQCGDSTMALMRFPAQDVASYTIVMTMKNGRTYARTLPTGTDAIFMCDHALQKFALPYYQGVRDQKKIALINNFLAQIEAKPQRGRATKPPTKPETQKP